MYAVNSTVLETIDCHDNILTSIYIASPEVVYIDVATNRIQTLDLSMSPAINELYFYDNVGLKTVYVNEHIDIVNLTNSKGENILLGGSKTFLQYKE